MNKQREKMDNLRATLEEVRAQFFDTDALVEPPYVLYRMDGGDGRWYYEPDGDRFYRSVTTIIQANQPTPFGVRDWLKRYGYRADDIRNERAAYGTFLHTQLAELLISGRYDFDALTERSWVSARAHGFPADPVQWYRDAVNDLLAFAAFMREHKVKPLGVEVCLKSELGYAGAIDLVCDMRVYEKGDFGEVYKSGPRKGEPKLTYDWIDVRALVDFKSGRKGFYDEHVIQLHMYREMWTENFPDRPVDRVFNWAPNDWRDTPTFKLSDQTDTELHQRIPHLLKLDALASGDEPPKYLTASGVLSADTELGDVYRMENIRDEFARLREAEGASDKRGQGQ